MLKHQNNITYKHAPTPQIFRKKVGDILYADIPSLRRYMVEFMEKNNIPKTYQSDMLFTLSEILTNLIKHPEKKADKIHLSLSIFDDHISLDVADNSTPFATFNAKCNNPRPLTKEYHDNQFFPAETGHGLKCILKVNTYVCYTPVEYSKDEFNHFTTQKYFSSNGKQKTKQHVFIIDDDTFALSFIQAVLEPTYQTTTFTNAHDALNAFQELKPNLIVCDINMPGISGLDLRKSLSHIPDGNTVPFIFLSADHEHKHRDAVNKLGVDGYINKENITNSLLSTANRLIYRAEQMRTSLQENFHTDLSDHLKPILPQKYNDCWYITTRNKMAEAGGGDFTLSHETEKSLICFLADVMGHGKKAKFFSYAYAGYLRSLFRLCTHENPAQFLTQLSHSVFEDDFLESIVLTCQGFQLKPDNTLKIVSAGHPPPLHIHFETGTITHLDATGPLPGLNPKPKYNALTLSLQEKDKVIFATDGFFQAFDTEDKGNENLIYLIRQNISLPANMLSEVIWRAFDERSKNSTLNQDDATLIIIEYGGHHEHK